MNDCQPIACSVPSMRSSTSFQKSHVSAFTLVELLVAVAIVAILVVCLSRGISSAIAASKRTACLSNMRTVASAIIGYANENDLRYPQADAGSWDIPLTSYLNGNSFVANPVLKCPADDRPLITKEGNFTRSYSLNANLPAKTIQMQETTRTILLAEWYTGKSGPGGASLNYQYNPNYSVVAYNLEGLPIQYHKIVSNFIFCDGHAESFEPRATVTPISFWALR